MWIEAAIPLAACLEKAHKGDFSVAEAIPMIQAALMLMGDTFQHQIINTKKDADAAF